MRKIKFRAYDKINKKWIYVSLHPTHISWSSPDFTAQSLLYSNDDCAEGISFAAIEGWQEYTGFKDKNGSDVYEGDIIDNGNGPVEVFWNENYGAWWVRFESAEPEKQYYAPCSDSDNCTEESVIVGNVHENPDLLKAKTL